MDGTLPLRDALKRRGLFIVMVLALLLCVVSVLLRLRDPEAHGVLLGSLGLIVVANSIVICGLLSKRRLNDIVVVGCIYMCGMSVCFIDLNARAGGTVMWPSLVLIVDLLLVMRVNELYTVGFVCVSVAWLAVLAAESVLRFGLMDLPGLLPQDGPGGRRELLDKMSSCENPPCAQSFGAGVLGFLAGMTVFIIDFITTRGFAREVLKEQATMERTITAVQEIAGLLALYDVDTVARLLDSHEGLLPQGMEAALRTLEENLRVYRAYLPKTCLSFDSSDENEPETPVTVQDRSSILSGNSAMICRAAGMGVLSTVKATLLTVNIKNSGGIVEVGDCFATLFTSLLLKTLSAINSARGMVDVFVGDRIYCSFNASRQCDTHASAALHAAARFLIEESPAVNIGVATGSVLRGDMGCDVMRRFSMIGSLVSHVHAIERTAYLLGRIVLCNRLCFQEAECEHPLRLLPCLLQMEEQSAPQAVAELVAVKREDKAVSSRARGPEEWMYVIGNKEWGDYNAAVQLYLKGGSTAAVLAAAGDKAVELRAALDTTTVKGGLVKMFPRHT